MSIVEYIKVTHLPLFSSFIILQIISLLCCGDVSIYQYMPVACSHSIIAPIYDSRNMTGEC